LVTTFNRWSGVQYLLRLFDTKQVSEVGVLSLYTGGRLGSSTSFVTQLGGKYEPVPIILVPFNFYSFTIFAASAIERNFESSESALEVRIQGAVVPVTSAASFPSPSFVIDL